MTQGCSQIQAYLIYITSLVLLSILLTSCPLLQLTLEQADGCKAADKTSPGGKLIALGDKSMIPLIIEQVESTQWSQKLKRAHVEAKRRVNHITVAFTKR